MSTKHRCCVILYTSLAWADWVACPDRWAMRRPETGMSVSTDSHAFFIHYTRSGAVYREFNIMHMKKLLLFVLPCIMMTPKAFSLGFEKEINGAYYFISVNGNNEYEAQLKGISDDVTDFVFQTSVSWDAGVTAKVVSIADNCFIELENLRTITLKDYWEDTFPHEFKDCTSLQKIIGLKYVMHDYETLNFEGCRSLDTSFDWLPQDIFISELKCSLGNGEKVVTPLIHLNGMIGAAEFSGWCPIKVLIDSFKSDDNYYKVLGSLRFSWENLTDIEIYRSYTFDEGIVSGPELRSIKIDNEVSNILGLGDCPKLETIDLGNVRYYNEFCETEENKEEDISFQIGYAEIGAENRGAPNLHNCSFPYMNYLRTLYLYSTRIPNGCKLPKLNTLEGDDVYFESIPEFPKTLNKLILNNSYIGDSITLSLPNVKELNLTDLVGIKYLNLWDCPKVDDGGAYFIAQDDVLDNAGYWTIATLIQPQNNEYAGDLSLPNLKEFGFGDKVERLPKIKNCPSLTDIIYGGTIAQWMNLTFPCYQDYVTVSEEESSLPGIKRLWYGDGSKKTKYLKNLTVLDSDRTSVPPAAFSGYEGLETIFIMCDTVGQGAFRNCPNLSDVVFEGSYIETLAFSECHAIRQFTLGKNFKKAIYRAFENAGPYNLNFMGSMEEWANVDFVNSWIDRGHEHSWIGNLEKSISPTQNALSFHIGNIPVVQLAMRGVRKVKTGTFSGVNSLKSVEIDSSTPVFLDDYAFSECENLEYIKISPQSRSNDSEITIGEKTFFNDIKLKDIDFINRVDEIGTDALENTAWFENKSNGLIYVGSTAYKYKGLGQGHVKINPGTKYIAGNCFYNQKDILSVDIPDGMLKIGNDAFYWCDNIKNFIVPESVVELKSIPNECTDIFLEDGIEPLLMDLYITCPSLRNLYIGREINGNTSNFMDYMPSLQKLTIGKNITKLTSNMVASHNLAYPELTILEVLAPIPPALQYEEQKIWNDETGNYEEVLQCVSLRAFDPAKVKLLVPAESIDLYKSAPEWNKFYNIDTSKIDVPIKDKKATVKARYDMEGHSVSDNFKGIVIEILSDGTVRKQIY